MLDSKLNRDLLCDSELFQNYFFLLLTNQQSCKKSTTNSNLNNALGSNFMQIFLCEDSLQYCYDNEVVSHLRATVIGYRRVNSFEWWRSNDRKYPIIAPVVRDVLFIAVSSVCSGECFSVADNMVDSHLTRISNDSISVRKVETRSNKTN